MDWKAFIQAKYEPRQEFIPIPELAPFQAGVEVPGILVKSLSGTEWWKAKQPAQKDYINIFAKLFQLSPDKIVEGFKEIFDPETPVELGTRIMILYYAIVDDALKEADRLEACIKINKVLGFDFMHLTNKITLLSGMGFEQKKKQ